MSDMICPICNTNLEVLVGGANAVLGCPRCRYKASDGVWQELIRTRKVLDKSMRHITGLNNMIESWYKLLQSDKDTSTKYAILKSAISAYVENERGEE